jgi:hypothetical protein
MNQYSEKLKQSMASKILMPGGPSAFSLARETGISHDIQSITKNCAEVSSSNGLEILAVRIKKLNIP